MKKNRKIRIVSDNNVFSLPGLSEIIACLRLKDLRMFKRAIEPIIEILCGI